MNLWAAVVLACLLAIVSRGKVIRKQTSNECNTDTMCDYRCCTYTEEFATPMDGECVEIKEFPRCEDRKKHHRIALFTMLACLIITVFICSYLKKKESANKKQALMQLKIEKAHQENIKGASKSVAQGGPRARAQRRGSSDLTKSAQPQIERAQTQAQPNTARHNMQQKGKSQAVGRMTEEDQSYFFSGQEANAALLDVED